MPTKQQQQPDQVLKAYPLLWVCVVLALAPGLALVLALVLVRALVWMLEVASKIAL